MKNPKLDITSQDWLSKSIQSTLLNYQTKDQFRINTDESNASRYDKHIIEPSMISTKSNAPLNQSKRNFKMQLDPITEKCPNQSKDARSFQSNKYKLHIKDKGLYYDIKIDKLHDFVNEPLKMYDEKQSDDDCIYELLSKGIHLQGISKWTNQDQTVIHKPCVVVDYNRKTQQFLIQWMDNEQIKEVCGRAVSGNSPPYFTQLNSPTTPQLSSPATQLPCGSTPRQQKLRSEQRQRENILSTGWNRTAVALSFPVSEPGSVFACRAAG